MTPEPPDATPVGELPAGRRPIEPVGTSVAGFVGPAPSGPVSQPVRLRSVPEFERSFGAAGHSGLGVLVRDFFRNGGTDARVVRTPADAGGRFTASGYTDAVQTLDGVEPVNLLVLAPELPGDSVPDAAWAPTLAWAARRRVFVLVDPPADATTSRVGGWAASVGLTGEDTRNAAVYWPRVRVDDPLTGVQQTVAPSGVVAGVFARTDASSGVWRAPAGRDATLVGVTGPALPLRPEAMDALAPEGVNVIRSLPVGTVVWGARTLRSADAPDDEYKYVPVRRTALFVEESLSRGLQWAVFEPNDEGLWSGIRDSVETFLHRLFLEGAFRGANARAAYLVRAGRDTTTQADLDGGVVMVEVGFAPVRPAEFVVIRIRLATAG